MTAARRPIIVDDVLPVDRLLNTDAADREAIAIGALNDAVVTDQRVEVAMPPIGDDHQNIQRQL